MPEWDDEDDAERRRVAHSELRAHARDVDRQNSLIAISGTVECRKAVWDWLSVCGVFSDAYDRDPIEMARKNGRRQIGVWMLALLEAERPGAYAQMSAENAMREQRYELIQEPR